MFSIKTVIQHNYSLRIAQTAYDLVVVVWVWMVPLRRGWIGFNEFGLYFCAYSRAEVEKWDAIRLTTVGGPCRRTVQPCKTSGAWLGNTRAACVCTLICTLDNPQFSRSIWLKWLQWKSQTPSFYLPTKHLTMIFKQGHRTTTLTYDGGRLTIPLPKQPAVSQS